MRTRLPVLFALLAALALAAPAGAPAAKRKRPPKPPSAKVVKKLINDHFAKGGKPDSFGHIRTIEWTSVSVRKGRRASPAADLIRPGTWVFPSRAKFDMKIFMPSWGDTILERWDAKIKVFRDDHGDWSFTNDDVKSEKVRCTHSDGSEYTCP